MMISRILEQQRALTQVLSEDKKVRHLIPTWQDLDILESVSKSLGPLLDFTDTLSGEDYVSVAYVKPVVHLFNTTMLLMQEEDTDLTKILKSKMLDYINEKYKDETQKLLDVASCLDPRFKMDFISADNKPQVKARVTSEMMKCQETSSCSNEVEPKVADLSQVKKAKKSLGFAKLARKYLCIPATSSPSERHFSASGNIVTCQRSCHMPAVVDRLVFLARNL